MGSTEEDGNGWDQWKKLVLSELKDLKSGQAEFRDDVQSLRVDMAVLKTKAGVWGALAGAVPVAIGLMLHWLTGRKN